MTVVIDCKRTIAIDSKRVEIEAGSSVRGALERIGSYTTPGELEQVKVYAQGRDQELVPLDKNEPLNQDTVLVTISPVLGTAPVAPADTTLRMFWKGATEELRRKPPPWLSDLLFDRRQSVCSGRSHAGF